MLQKVFVEDLDPERYAATLARGERRMSPRRAERTAAGRHRLPVLLRRPRRRPVPRPRPGRGADRPRARGVGPGPGRRRHRRSPTYMTAAGRAIPVRYNGAVARMTFGPVTAARVRKWLAAGEFDVLHLHEPVTPEPRHARAVDRRRTDRGDVPHRADPVAAAADGVPAGPAVAGEDLGPDRGLRGRPAHARRAHGRRRRRDPERRLRRRVRRRASPTRAGPGTPERPTIAFLGRLDEARKGLPVLLERRAARARRRSRARGSSSPAAARRVPTRSASCSASEAAGAVEFLGGISDEDKARLLASVDVYCAPADRRRELRDRARRGDERRRDGRRERPRGVLARARRRRGRRPVPHRATAPTWRSTLVRVLRDPELRAAGHRRTRSRSCAQYDWSDRHRPGARGVRDGRRRAATRPSARTRRRCAVRACSSCVADGVSPDELVRDHRLRRRSSLALALWWVWVAASRLDRLHRKVDVVPRGPRRPAGPPRDRRGRAGHVRAARPGELGARRRGRVGGAVDRGRRDELAAADLPALLRGLPDDVPARRRGAAAPVDRGRIESELSATLREALDDPDEVAALRADPAGDELVDAARLVLVPGAARPPVPQRGRRADRAARGAARSSGCCGSPGTRPSRAASSSTTPGPRTSVGPAPARARWRPPPPR